MKKLMVLASAIAVTCTVNAASCAWGFVSGAEASDGSGDWYEGGTAFLYSGDVSFDATSGWVLGTASLIATSGYDDNMGGYGFLDSGNLPSYDAVALSDGDAYTLILIDGTASDITSWTGDDKNYYLESVVSVVTTEPTATGSITYAMITTDTYVDTWSSAATSTVPEPTSGLLMLLGMAGLALRRRRA